MVERSQQTFATNVGKQARNSSSKKERVHWGHMHHHFGYGAHSRDYHEMKQYFSNVRTIVISVQAGGARCDSCAYSSRLLKNVDYKKAKTYQDPDKFTKNFRGCRRQFDNAHAEADQVEELYRQLGNGKCLRLKNPTVEALDNVLCPIIE